MATLFEDELVLPGVITEIIESYSEGYDTTLFGTTESMIVIGTAFNGPVGKVIPTYSPEHAKYMFGDSFDPKTRKQATLIPAIYDAWEKGCRTIYAVRVSGQEMYKDYSLAIESKLKLRLRALTPSNTNKECYFMYEASQGEGLAGTFRIYKPSSKATIAEKMQGIVDGSDVILVSEINLDNYSVTKETKLSDAINLFNENLVNNGLRLSIVNEKGVDVTLTDSDAHMLSLGAMFPGIYTICRDKNAKGVIAVTDVEYVKNSDSKLYGEFDGAVWKKLVLNSDINAEYPIYAIKNRELTNKLLGTGIIADDNHNWLKTVGNLNKVFLKDKVDYEEVELDTFDLYKRLGSGFAKTAKIEEVKKGNETFYKVIETPHGDENKVIGINDGIYSRLENYGTDYRVLACATAEDKISSRLPKKDTFKISNPNAIKVKDVAEDKEVIIASALLEKKDFSNAKKYAMAIEKLEDLEKEEILENLDTENIYKRLPLIDMKDIDSVKDLEDGDLVFVSKSDASQDEDIDDGFLVKPDVNAPGGGSAPGIDPRKKDKNKSKKASQKNKAIVQLFAFNKAAKRLEIVKPEFFTEREDGSIKERFAITEVQDGKLSIVPMHVENKTLENDSYVFTRETLNSKEGKYVIVESKIANIARIEAGYITPICSLMSLLDLEEGNDYTIAYIDQVPFIKSNEENTMSIIRVISNKLDWSSYEELVQDLNEEIELSKLFSFSLTDPTIRIEDVASQMVGVDLDRKEPIYDTNMYVPYSTSDNFARQFAQHAMMTSFHSFPTHAVIGCKPLNGVTLESVANRVDEIASLNLDLYFKKANGNNMLDKNNMPYSIGRCLSLTFMPYGVTTGNGYTAMTTGAAGYAGMVTTLAADRSSTNQPININSMAVELSSSQLKKLSGKGVVVCRQSTKGIVVADGVTQAPVESPFARLSTAKVVNIVDKLIKEACEPFIGLQENLSNRNSLETNIKSRLNGLLENLIKAYDFNLTGEASGQKVGTIYVDYVILPTNEIREVRNRVTIK